MDFAGAADRLRREQAQSLQRARLKAEEHRAEVARTSAARERAEEAKRERRLAQLRADEEARLAAEAALEASKGVGWSSGGGDDGGRSALSASAVEPERSAQARGIRRGSRDKARMPRGAGASLLAQGSHVNGAPFFELVAVGPPPPRTASASASEQEGGGDLPLPRRRRTHVGVLDYGCDDGRCALPPAVAARLWPRAKAGGGGGEAPAATVDGSGGVEATGGGGPAAPSPASALPLALSGTGVPAGARVVATYRALPKGTFARLQPLEAGFQAAAGEGVKEVLEAAVAQYSCLTEGDTVDVDVVVDADGGGDATATSTTKTFALRVQELRPADAVSLAETDLEVEVEPSEETAKRLAAEAEAEEVARRNAEEAARRLSESKRKLEEAAEAAARAAEAEGEARDVRRRELAASLPPQPPSSSPSPVVAFRLRTPDGRTAARRFLASETSVSVLFDWADSLEGGGAGAESGEYDLVVAGAVAEGSVLETPAASSAASAATLAEAGFERGGFALLVRPRGSDGTR